MITEQEILKGQPCPPEFKKNLEELLKRLNKFREIYGKPLIVNSGYRSPEHNAKIGGAKNSKHCQVMACDFKDVDGKLKEFCRANDYKVLKDCDLYMEDGTKTTTWLHLDIFPRKNREFKI